MPIFPLGPCRFRRCSKRGKYDGFCDEHRKQHNREYDRTRQADPIHKFYSSMEINSPQPASMYAGALNPSIFDS